MLTLLRQFLIIMQFCLALLHIIWNMFSYTADSNIQIQFIMMLFVAETHKKPKSALQ